MLICVSFFIDSDSGPLRLARTPSPPDDESPDSSPAASPNHTLRLASPGPPRPKSPSQVGLKPLQVQFRMRIQVVRTFAVYL